jgi:hypothetical protein
VAEGIVSVSEGGRTREVPLSAIERARLVFELVSQPKGAGKSTGPKGPGSADREHKQRKH